MAFVINKITSGQTVSSIAHAMREALALSRFTASVTEKKNSVEIGKVRLTYSKDYCGNHPFPCPVRAVHRKHPINRCLEGADWVGFNDMLNDVLDALECVCNCASSLVIIRKQGARCVSYGGHITLNGIDAEWDKDSGAFENCIVKKTERAYYPEGTPGFATSQGKPNYPENHTH